MSTIILIHGGASSGRVYKDVIPILERHGHTCIAPDLPGHGSKASQGLFTFEGGRAVVAATINDNLSEKEKKIMVVGISLGGQTVLSFLQNDTDAVNYVTSAIVSGAAIHGPDEFTPWELPRMPPEQDWLDSMMEDAKTAGWENMAALKEKSFSFTFEPSPETKSLPPVLAMVGEHDTPMSRRDLPELTEKLQKTNRNSESLIMKGAWHNHSIDVAEQFAKVILDWANKY